MSVSKKALEKIRKLFDNNSELVAYCYEQFLIRGRGDAAPFNQETIDFGFICFAFGLAEAITPGSNFNEKYHLTNVFKTTPPEKGDEGK